MPKVFAQRFALDMSSTGVTRLLVLSYFIALGLGLVDGVDVSVLAAPFAPLPLANFLGGLLVVGLSLMILLNFYRRASALVLALVVFWASYLTMVIHASPGQIGAFWRDLALIGALLLTYGGAAESVEKSLSKPARTDTKDIQHKLRPATPARDTALKARQTQKEWPQVSGPGHPKRVKSELYRQDLEVVRLS